MAARWAFLGGCVVAAALAAGAARAAEDELDALLKEAGPPPRFAGHKPDFRVEKARFKWTALRTNRGQGPAVACDLAEERRVLYDGPRLIGYLSLEHSRLWGHVRLFTMDPAHVPPVEPARWSESSDFRSYHQDVGDALTMVAVWGEADETRTEVSGGGPTLTIVRTDRFRPDGREPGRDSLAVHTARLRVDPQLGYVVDHRLDWRTNRVPLNARTGGPHTHLSGGDLWGWGVVNPWPGEGTYAQGFFSPGRTYRAARDGTPWAEPGAFAFYQMNGPTIEAIRHGWHPVVRPGGLVGYLDGPHGWGVCLTVVGTDEVRAAVCPAWGEFHLGGPAIPERPDADGSYRVSYARRLAGLPPEVQSLIRRRGRRLFEDRRCLAIRLDGEDFEDQPLSFAAPVRCVRFVGRGVSLSTDRARSGRQAIVAQGRRPEDLANLDLANEHPPVCFVPRARYRLECWAWVEDPDTEAFVIARQTPIPDPSIYLKEESIGTYRTASVKAGPGWQRLGMEFEAPGWGGLLSLGFVALGPGRAYFDDLRIRRVPEREGPGPVTGP